MNAKLPTSQSLSKGLSNLGTIVGTGSSVAVTIYILSIYSDIASEDRSGFIIVLALLTVAGFIGQIIDLVVNRKKKEDSTIIDDIQSIQIEQNMVNIQVPRQRIIISYRPDDDDDPGVMTKVWKEVIPGGQ